MCFAKNQIVFGIVAGLMSIGFSIAAESSKNETTLNPAYAAIRDVEDLSRVLLIGDSISIGYTLLVREALTGKANVHRPPENCKSTALGVDKLQSWLGSGKWDVIHFNFGLHDLRHVKPGVHFVSPERYEKNLREIVAHLKTACAALIFARTTPVGQGAKTAAHPRYPEDVYHYNEIALRVMKENGIAINDLHAMAKLEQKKYQNPDGVHFNRSGNSVFAEAVSSSILKTLERQNSAELHPESPQKQKK